MKSTNKLETGQGTRLKPANLLKETESVGHIILNIIFGYGTFIYLLQGFRIRTEERRNEKENTRSGTNEHRWR